MYIIHGTFMVQEFYAGFYNPLYRNFGAFLVRICYNNKNGRLPDVKWPPKVRQYFEVKIVQAAEKACCLWIAGGKPFSFALILRLL